MNEITIQFIEQWNQFLNSLESASKKKIERRNNPKYKPLEKLLDEILSELRKENAINSVKKAFDEQAKLTNDKILQFFTSEMEFFNNLCAGDGPSDADTDDAIGAGQTIKDSFEKLIKKLPDWIKRLLEILNEILSIIRGK